MGAERGRNPHGCFPTGRDPFLPTWARRASEARPLLPAGAQGRVLPATHPGTSVTSAAELPTDMTSNSCTPQSGGRAVVSSLASPGGCSQSLPVTHTQPEESEKQAPWLHDSSSGQTPRSRISGSRLWTISTCHYTGMWSGMDRPSAEPSPAHSPEARERCTLVEQDTHMRLTQFQVVLTLWDAGVRFPPGAVTQRSPKSARVWGVLRRSWGFFMGLHRWRCSCYREAGWGQGRATRPRSRDLPLTPGVTLGQSPPRWASVSHAQLQLASGSRPGQAQGYGI